MDNLCLGCNAQSHTPVHSGRNAHEIQQQHLVGLFRKSEAAVQINERVTTGSCRSQQQLVQRQQQAKRQLQQQEQSSWNDFGVPQGVNIQKKTFKNIFPIFCSYENLLTAFIKARKRKTKKEYVKAFEKNLKSNLLTLQWQLQTGTYKPSTMKTFTIRDPKTRKISASQFRDRVVHHAICNLISPIFQRRFIHDTFANRKGKGTSAILKRFEFFKQKVGKNGYVLKADIRHYFEEIDKEVLLSILEKRIKDKRFIDVILIILENHKQGMPLGNLTSQEFANIYLAELDNFVKHELKIKYYVRYVDDFIILNKNKKKLEEWKQKISEFLNFNLKISLHKDKTKIIQIRNGVGLVGFRIFFYHKILKKSNLRRLKIRLLRYRQGLLDGTISKEHITMSLAGWNGYARLGNTFNLRNKITRETNGGFAPTEPLACSRRQSLSIVNMI